MKKLVLILAILSALCLATLPAYAEGEALPLTLSQYQKGLQDENESRSYTLESVTVESETPLSGLYVIFFDQTPALTLTAGEETRELTCTFLRQWIDLEALFGTAQTSVTLTFSEKTGVTELYGFGESVPDWVQIWQAPCEKADLCLMTTHADDEQLFFAGVLPYYAGEKGAAVQVIYFTDHVNEPLRRHELLRGLWTVGVTHYPVIGPFPDLYSTSGQAAENQLNSRGFSHEDIVAFQVEMLRRFRPLVVVGHDPLGEYGHGQHILNCATLREAVDCSADENAFPESAETYGTYDVPKTYLHLWQENPITMNWDVPLEAFGGKTAFQMTQEGFLCHDSQQYTWFRRWLLGNAGEITRADQIRTHSPCSYGLYRSLVGEDVEKNDFFENQMTYEEIRLKEEEERLRKEAEERARLEEEALRAEEERLAKEAEAAILKAQKEKEKKEKILLFSMIGALSLIVIVVIVLFLLSKRKKKTVKSEDLGILE